MLHHSLQPNHVLCCLLVLQVGAVFGLLQVVLCLMYPSRSVDDCSYYTSCVGFCACHLLLGCTSNLVAQPGKQYVYACRPTVSMHMTA